MQGIVRSHHRAALFIDHSALFINSFRRYRDVVSVKKKRSAAFSQSNRSLLHALQAFWLSVDFTDGARTTVPLIRGLFGFVALRCYTEECAFSLSTQAQGHAWDLVEYEQVEPAHCSTGATTGGIGCERNMLWGLYHPLSLCARLVLCMTGVFELALNAELAGNRRTR